MVGSGCATLFNKQPHSVVLKIAWSPEMFKHEGPHELTIHEVHSMAGCDCNAAHDAQHRPRASCTSLQAFGVPDGVHTLSLESCDPDPGLFYARVFLPDLVNK